MHLKSLKVFCDVVGRRSFSRAASENGISQSGASQIVNALEEHLGVKLIDRTKRPFVLTPEGEVYYEGCRKLVQRYFALEEEVKTLHEEVAGRVSVASIYSIGLSHMSRFVQRFLQAYPKSNVRLQYHHPGRVYEMVESDLVDLGLVSFPRSSRTIKATVWREEPMVLVCAPTHRLATRDRVSLEDLHGLEIIAFDPDLEIRHEIDRALAARGVEVRVAMEFDNTETIKRAVEIDAGVSLLPAPTVDRELAAGALVARPLVGIDLKRPIGIVQRRGKELGKTASRFMQLLLKYPSSSREIADLDEPESEQAAATERGAADGSFTDELVPTAAAASSSPTDAAARVAS
ncbi:MAG: LysR family transcriptional regulator [Pirellulaceae bacterium]|jgi:DNA-binding transcriptional LysR family regulator|nr:LysR family transcriptional regulator [Pirellulaceae bacterium]